MICSITFIHAFVLIRGGTRILSVGAVWGKVHGHVGARQYVHYRAHYNEQVLLGAVRGIDCPCHPAGGAHVLGCNKCKYGHSSSDKD